MDNQPEAIVDVAVPYRVSNSFHYLVEPSLREALHLGSVIQVPFRTGSTHAFVLGFPQSSPVAKARLKLIEGVVVNEPVFDEKMLKFLRWVSDYYCHPLGEVIATALPRPYWQPPKRKKKTTKTGKDDSLDQLGITGIPSAKPILNAEQLKATQILTDPHDLRPALLHGVTGSGKTEVYMHVLEHALNQGKGGIVLVPEIALTPQLMGRFSARFPGLVAVLHSDLTPRERNAQWERLRTGNARIVIGARSAVFAPVKNLGLIVVDEEHESSFKQEDSVHYHGRDVAVVRGHFYGAKVILGSATPSLESYHNAQTGKIRLSDSHQTGTGPRHAQDDFRGFERRGTEFSSPI